MRIHLWNFLFSLFYAVLVIYGIWFLAASRLIFYDVPVRDIILISLAIFRLTRLFTFDHITDFIRGWFVNAKPNTFGHTAGALLNCLWCTGLWFGFIVIFFYFATPYAWPVILILAVAAVGSFLQILANWVGSSAKLARLEAVAFEQSNPGARTNTCSGDCG